ncbi:MAG: B12-binding domain-containing radical SAM protein [Candidatus Helarchaeota archaeon]
MVTIVFLRPKMNIPEPAPFSHHGIGYIASILRKNGHQVHYIDCAIRKEPYSRTIQEIKRLNPDAIGITAISAQYSEMRKLSRILRKLNIPIILGGTHVTALPEISLRECGADFVVLGEGELTISELMNNWHNKETRKHIKGIAYIENDQFIMNPQRELIENLDELPFPAWDLIDPRKYPPVSYFKVKHYPVGAVFTSRGCPHYCSFCTSCAFWRHKYRKRSAKNVVDEIEYLMNEFGVREILIADDYFNCDKNHVIEFCREIIQRQLNVSLTCYNGLRVENIDRKLLTFMRKAGFYAFTIAIESGSQAILNKIHKKLNLKKISHAIKLAKSLGFFLEGFIIFGLPGETYKSVRQSIQLVKNLPYNVVAFHIAKPLPGSSWFDEWVVDKDFSKIDYDWFHFVEIKNQLTYSDGKRTIKLPVDAIREHFFRPIQLFRYLKYWVSTFNLHQSFVPIGRFVRIILNLLLHTKKGKPFLKKSKTFK